MINVTKHALQRYVERIKHPETECNSDIEYLINANRSQYTQDLNKMFDQSRLIYTGRFNDKHNEVNFRKSDNIMLITDKADSKIITLYRIEFGFGREADMELINTLVKNLDEAEEIYKDKLSIIKEEKDKYEAKRIIMKSELEEYKKTMKNLEQRIKALTSFIDSITCEEQQAKTNYNIIAKQLAYSNIYREAMDKYTVE